MFLLDFIKRFPDEQACKDYLRGKREREGLSCRRCGHKRHYWVETVDKWNCAKCGKDTTLKAGTIMEKSKLPLMYWFTAIHLLTSTKKSFSALEIQRQLGHKRYEPIWYMVNKIRIVMGNRDAAYKLCGEVEVDDAYFEIVDLERPAELKRGRGSERQIKVLVMVESEPATFEDKKLGKHRPKRKMGRVKMQVIEDTSNLTINYEVRRSVEYHSLIHSDAWTGNSRIGEVVEQHNMMRVPSKEAHKMLPWVHIVISNAKRLFLGTHHSIGKSYLQNYLNQYCYKLNRRFGDRPLFERMLSAGIEKPWYRK